MADVSVKSRVARTLRGLRRFIADPTVLDEYAGRLRTAAGDVLGVYQNPDGVPVSRIVVTSRGLYLIGEQGERFLAFDDIANVAGPAQKVQAGDLELSLKSGESIDLPIRGGDQQFRDVFEFLRFLDRVIADLRD